MNKTNDKIAVVYCVTCYGRVLGVYASADDAFQVQMASVNKGRVAELVPMPIIYPETLKSE